jgi:hypothetical protein
MKKTVKTIVAAAASLLVILIAALATLPLWIGPAVTGIANAVVPNKAKTEFKLDGFYFNQYNGRMEIGGLYLANPKGYDEPVALKVKNIFVDVDMSSVLSDTITIDELSIDDVFVSYVFEDGVDNFTRIGNNFNSDVAESSEDAEKETKGNAGSDGQADVSKSDAEESADAKKLIIKKLSLNNVKFKYRSVTVPVPSIVLTGIGEKTNGATILEIFETIFNSLVNAIGSLGESLGELSTAFGDGVIKINDKAGNAIKKLGADAEAVLNGENMKKLDEGTKKSVEMIKSLFK